MPKMPWKGPVKCQMKAVMTIREMTLEKLAKATKMPITQLSLISRGRNVTMRNAVKISKALKEKKDVIWPN